MTDDAHPSDPFDADAPGTRIVTPRPPRHDGPDADALVDAWPDARPFALDGWMERNGFTPIWTSVVVFVFAFIAFQVIGAIVMAFSIIPEVLASGDTAVNEGDVMALMAENADGMLIGNSVGQFLAFGLLALLVARLHSSRPAAFLRLRVPDWPVFALAAVGWVALVPAIQWLGSLNALLPQPEWLDALEASQMELIEGVLTSGDLSTPFLFFALAITPAICEELIFRGYFQRQVERKWGLWASILIVGIGFGFYHLRLTQVVPLSLLGIWMGYTVWASGSLWTGMLVHVLNNGMAVLVSAYLQGQPDVDMAALEEMSMPWYYGVLGLLVAAGIGSLIWQRRLAVVGTTPDARPVPVPDLSAPPLVPATP